MMPALTLGADGRGAALTNRPVPVISDPADVLVRLTATGICGTDRAILLGEFPALPGVVLGHESVGVIADVGPAVRGVRLGDRVVVNPTFYCTTCGTCRRGQAALCPNKAGRELGVDRDGTMAPYVVIAERFAHRVRDDIPDQRAALVEPLACVLNNLRCAAPRWDDRILILGGGPIGALCALVLAVRGFRVAVAEPDDRRAELVRGSLPRTLPVLPGPDPAYRPNIVIDTVGTLPGRCLDLVADGATVVIMGERTGAVAAVPLRLLATRAVRIIGAGPYAPADFEMALDLATDLPLESLVSHVLPLERAERAMALLGVPGPSGGYAALKVLLTTSGPVR
jgi:fructokinase